MHPLVSFVCLTPYQAKNFLDKSKLKAFADDKINVTEKLKFVLGRVENIVLVTSIFFFSHNVFKRLLIQGP